MDDTGKKNKKIPCNICSKNIRGNAKAVCCDVIIGYTLNAIVYLPVNMMNYARKITMNLSSVLNALIMNYLLD